MRFPLFARLKPFAAKWIGSAYRYAKPYITLVSKFTWVVLCSIVVYVYDALKNLLNRARKDPFVALAALAAIIYAGYAYNQWQVMQGQLNEMQTQVQVMRGQLEEMQEEQRPWVTITDPPEIISPLVVKSSGVGIDLLFSFHNTGHFPSIGVLPSTFGIPHRIRQIGDEFPRACNFRNPGMGVYVFPGDTPTQPVSVFIPSSDVDAFWRENPNFRPIIAPVIFVCVVYWEPTSHKPHHTPFAYELMRKHSYIPNRYNASVYIDEGDVPIDNLFLRRQIIGVPGPD
jgi:hypothetical protein